MNQLEKTLMWVEENFPQSSPKDIKEKALLHYEEWNSCREFYGSIEKYFEEVEERGDFY